MLRDLIVWPWNFNAYRRLHFALGIPNWALVFFVVVTYLSVLMFISTVLGALVIRF